MLSGPRDDRRTDHLSLESSQKQTKAHSLTEEQKSWRSVRGLYVLARRKHAHTKYIFSEATLRCRGERTAEIHHSSLWNHTIHTRGCVFLAFFPSSEGHYCEINKKKWLKYKRSCMNRLLGVLVFIYTKNCMNDVCVAWRKYKPRVV